MLARNLARTPSSSTAVDGELPSVGQRPLTSRLVGQPKARAPVEPDAGPVLIAHAGGGGALPAPVQAQMGEAFGADFSDVRVHVDGRAEAIGAQAFASGRDLHFAAGQYDPGSEAGLALIGHELAHVVQQADGRVAGAEGQLVVDAGLEREADELGARAARREVVGGGGRVGGAGPVQGKGVVQAFLPAVPAGAAALGELALAELGMYSAEILAWAGTEAGATTVQTLLALGGAAASTAGGAGAALQPGAFGVQQYSLPEWKAPRGQADLQVYMQAKLIDKLVELWANDAKARAASAATPAAPAPTATDPAVAPPSPSATAPATSAPATAAPPAETRPSQSAAVLDALKAIALAMVQSDLAGELADARRDGINSQEFIWADSGGSSREMGTVGSIMIHQVHAYRLRANIKLGANALSDPLIAASGLEGRRVDIAGIIGGEVIAGPSMNRGYFDSLAINVSNCKALDRGLVLTTSWQWDSANTTLAIAIEVDESGHPVFTEVSRIGVVDDFSWL